MKRQYRKAVKTRKQHQLLASVKKTVYMILIITATYWLGSIDAHTTLIQGYKSIEAYSQSYDKVCADSICSQVIEVKKENK